MRKDKALIFMKRAQFFADTFSKDSSSKIGALFVNHFDFRLLTRGYNGIPRGIDESVPERQARPLKYSFYEHAERNAIYNLARPQLKGSLVVTTAPPTLSCVRALISVGVKELVCPGFEQFSPENSIALTLLSEAGIDVVRVSKEGTCLQPVCDSQSQRHARKIAQFFKLAQDLKNGCCKDPLGDATFFLAPDDYTQITEGYSGMPRGADDSQTERYAVGAREKWVEPSIRNAIYNLVRDKLQDSVALVTAPPCVECARAIVGVGTQKIIYVEPSEDFKARWGDSLKTGVELLAELGVSAESMNRLEIS